MEHKQIIIKTIDDYPKTLLSAAIYDEDITNDELTLIKNNNVIYEEHCIDCTWYIYRKCIKHGCLKCDLICISGRLTPDDITYTVYKTDNRLYVYLLINSDKMIYNLCFNDDVGYIKYFNGNTDVKIKINGKLDVLKYKVSYNVDRLYYLILKNSEYYIKFMDSAYPTYNIKTYKPVTFNPHKYIIKLTPLDDNEYVIRMVKYILAIDLDGVDIFDGINVKI